MFLSASDSVGLNWINQACIEFVHPLQCLPSVKKKIEYKQGVMAHYYSVVLKGTMMFNSY